jgi:transcriptional regulator with XRE-family HTH domain
MNRHQQPNGFLDSYSIGLKLKALRSEKRCTLSRLAAETGFSTALLSKIETDRMVPTLPTLARLCQVYGVSLSFFFSYSTQHSLSITRKAHILGSGNKRLESVNSTTLHAPKAQSSMTARILDIPSSLPSSIGERGCRTELVAYVLEGRLQITSGGSHEVLETGDCAVLDSKEPALWRALGEARCRVLSVTARTRPE